MAEFNPFDQILVLKTSLNTAEDTDLTVSPMMIDGLYKQDVGTCANYSSQIGASFMMLLIVIFMTPSMRLIKASLCVHVAALVVNIVRMTLLVLFFTSPNWTNFYTRFASDYSLVTTADFHLSITTEATSLVLHILVQVSLGIQAWALVKLLPRPWKGGVVVLSCFVSASAIGLRLGLCIIQINAILMLSSAHPIWVAQGSGVVGAISIAHYCALFNIKLLIHLVKNRGILPRRQRLNAMEVLIITNGILMVIPEFSHPRQRDQTGGIDLIDIELQRIDRDDLEKGFIIVNRKVEFCDEKKESTDAHGQGAHTPPEQARYSPPRDFVRDDMKPAPLRLSPKTKETDEIPDVSLKLGASSIKNATHTDDSTPTERATGQLSNHPTQLKNPPLAAIVSKFEILDVMTDLETQATTGHGTSNIEVPRSPANNSTVRKDLGVCVTSGLAKEPPPRLVHDDVVERQSTPSLSQTSLHKISLRGSQSYSETGIQPAVEPTTYVFDPFTGERRPNKAGRSADGRQKSLVAERRQMFEAPMSGVSAMSGKSQLKIALEQSHLWTQGLSTTVTKRKWQGKKLGPGAYQRALDIALAKESSLAPEDTEVEGSSSGFGPEPWMSSILEKLQPQNRDTKVSKHQTGQRARSQEEPQSGHATSMTALPEPSGNAAIVTAQNKVASLRRLFDKSANDAGQKSGSPPRRSYTGPTDKVSTHSNSQTVLRSGHEQQPQCEVSMDGAIRRSFQAMADAHSPKGSTSSSLKDRINTLEAICRIDAETRPSTNKTISASRSNIPGTEREADSSKSHAENRFESLGFKRGREVWRKISASWEKSRLEEGKRNGNDHTKQRLDKSQEQRTWQGSYLTTARPDDTQLADCSPDEPTTGSPPASASAPTRVSPFPARKSTSAIPRECLSIGTNLDGCSEEQKGALPLSTTGPVGTSYWWQLGSASSQAAWRTRWDALSGDAPGISWGRWRAPRERGLMTAGAECRMHHTRPLPTVRLGEMRKAANRQSETRNPMLDGLASSVLQ
ncbi:pheromone receptor [Colletotrichum salicis]|uniref:Pheromone receptor n=1 Tax=Colletotrichum salicis TaxID=1209931 RepID=A0A135UGB1_9PEZI|nr:pheromone receptor [Colletotrichum salicis]